MKIKYICKMCGEEFWDYKCCKRKFCSKECSNKNNKKIGKDNHAYKHGFALRTKYNYFYHTWASMKSRCYDKNNQSHYPRWGGRGINVCDKWLNFQGFMDDMYTPYLEHVKEFGRKNTQIERENNNGNYCKKNCKWATLIDQANNKRNNKYYTFDGFSGTLPQWERKLKLDRGILWRRINRDKWPIERALTSKKFVNQVDSPIK